jgi:hypothetical protein
VKSGEVKPDYEKAPDLGGREPGVDDDIPY